MLPPCCCSLSFCLPNGSWHYDQCDGILSDHDGVWFDDGFKFQELFQGAF